MKQFFKYVLATVVGFFLTFVLIIFFFSIFIASTISGLQEQQVTNVKPNSVLHIQLNYPIKERTDDSPFENFDIFNMEPQITLGLDDILKNIQKAKDDPNIQGIYLDLFYLRAGWAQVHEIREALLDFKTTGKFIKSYGEVYTQRAYYLASVSDKIFLNPEGFVQFNGLNVELTFYKGALEKLDIEPQIIRHGKFKAATEPYFLEKMSEANREQLNTFISGIYGEIIKNISSARNIPEEELRTISNELLADNANGAVQYGLVDSVYFKDQVLSSFRSELKIGKNDKINFVSLKKYRHSPSKESYQKNKIAVIYGSGTIVSGDGDRESLGGDRVSKAIRKARLDSNVKAIVLRVNSPGGSSIASDVIWREIVLAKDVKPVVVSMSSLAASGGYYIACPADKIVAQPFTITGSIGVFGILFNAQKLYNDKLGITFDQVKTSEFADLGNTARPLTEAEIGKFQKEVDRIYDSFVNKVSKGRDLSYAEVDSIAQGRIWSGIDAKRIGLVDELGGLETSINIAAEMAGVEKYRTISLPKKRDFKEELLKNILGEAKALFIEEELEEYYSYLKKLKDILKLEGIQMRIPFDIELK
ncbi:MAG: signal peptide peptidase SppA [Bacteroidetes bacterium]|nr:signal peptide peptidase SppA [Bacteroidia bacterium]PCH67791.1 MAG: signal peptide peptidase SppA [Bacteroidota bacterium]